MNNKNVWGTYCECSNEVYTFKDEHPWNGNIDIIEKVKCDKCGKVNEINCFKASEYLENKIYECFKNISGKVLEIGCGGGLITNYLVNNHKVEYLVTLDNDNESISEISNKHINMDLNKIDLSVFDGEFDYVVCRDVLMYLNDIDYTLKELSKISKKVILLNWYNVEHKNCINKTEPIKILEIASKYYDNLELIYPWFYKNGYIIQTKE